MAHASQEFHIHDDSQWGNPLNTHTESIEREAADVQQNQAAAGPSEFSPDMKGRLFTALDATISSDCKIHPTASLSYDGLLPALRATFDRCPMYLEKHLDYVNYLRLLSSTEIDKVSEASEREGLKRLGIQISTEEGDKKKWQCSVVGCEYKGTRQHVASHLRTKAHLGIPMFECPGCGVRFHHVHDRDRHKNQKTCIRSSQVEEAGGPQRSGRSLRGSQEQVASMPKAKGRLRTNHHLVGEAAHQNPAQTHAPAAESPRARKSVYYDPKFQAPALHDGYNHNILSISSAPPIFGVPLHQTIAYQQAQLPDVSFAHQGTTGVHPTYHDPQLPDLFPTPYILPVNYGGMHANSIINNNIHTPNPYAVPGLPLNVTYAPPHSVSYPPHSSNQHSSQTSHERVQRSQGPPPYDLSGYPHGYEGGGRKVKRPRTSMSSGRTPVAPSLQIDPQDPATTIRDPNPFHGPQPRYPY